MRTTHHPAHSRCTLDTARGKARQLRGSDSNEADADAEPPTARTVSGASDLGGDTRLGGDTCLRSDTGKSPWRVAATTLSLAGLLLAAPIRALANDSLATHSASPVSIHTERDDPAAVRAKLVKAFVKLSAKRQLEVLAKLEAAIAQGDERTAARLRANWTTSSVPAAPTRNGMRTKKQRSRTRRGKPRVHRWEGQVPFAVTREYRFPTKNIESITLTAGSKRKVLRGRKHEAELRLRQFRGLLDGYAKDTDAIVANVLQHLDTDPGEDRFAAFLDGWQDKGKPFYVALDETAGTQKSVFFFDAMLAEFLRKVPSKAERAPLASSLDAAHDALHTAFLNYRQYRALREAIALHLVLPPDAQLPAHLRSYDEVDGYSTRDFLRLLLVMADDDPVRLLNGIQRTAPALPQPLWDAKYEPLEALSASFKAQLDRLDRHSDQVLEQTKTEAQAAWQAARKRALAAAKTALL